ncbi:hypothetical protein [Amycolatopsis sp.]|uniref:hypothetical protein n=1 Tax=Amycolatopsis sp. TaxID=37632 RepID=UPI002C765BC8|nr:hypothetical protein [Amycolatopsis sp.]HVV10868.1 hypothetical protein [Amycolatopsis sp.]
MKPAWGTGIAVLALLLAGCDQVDAATSKTSACAEALGLSNIDVHLDPDELAAQARQKADRLRALADEVSDQDLKQQLGKIADSYLALEQRKLDNLSNLNEWAQRNAANLSALRTACL